MKKVKLEKNKRQKKSKTENFREKFFRIARIPKKEQHKFAIVRI